METYEEICKRQEGTYKVPGWLLELNCSSCGGIVHPLKSDFVDPSKHKFCGCDAIQNLRDLRSFGYKDAPETRFFGGPYAMRRPDGTIVSEEDFSLELERLLGEEN